MGGRMIPPNRENPRAMLASLVVELHGKGQIETRFSSEEANEKAESENSDFRYSSMSSFGSMSAVDRLLGRFGLGSAAKKREAAFREISRLIRESKVPKADVLLKNIERIKDDTGKLRGEDVAQVIAMFLEQTQPDPQDATPALVTATPMASETSLSPATGAFTPKGRKSAPASGGLHFLKHSPLELQAMRVIVPVSLARQKSLSAVPERDVGSLPKLNGQTYLVAMNDDLSAVAGDMTKRAIHDRYLSLLKDCSGAVVISPEAFDAQALQEMVEASLKACDSNPTLSVTFAVPDKENQEKLTDAYAKIMVQRLEARELDIDGGLDDENSIASLTGLWKEF